MEKPRAQEGNHSAHPAMGIALDVRPNLHVCKVNGYYTIHMQQHSTAPQPLWLERRTSRKLRATSQHPRTLSCNSTRYLGCLMPLGTYWPSAPHPARGERAIHEAAKLCAATTAAVTTRRCACSRRQLRQQPCANRAHYCTETIGGGRGYCSPFALSSRYIRLASSMMRLASAAEMRSSSTCTPPPHYVFDASDILAAKWFDTLAMRTCDPVSYTHLTLPTKA